MPSLRERSADIPELVAYFLEHFNMIYNRRAPAISNSLMRLLQAYHWPGNIRQLENLIKRYVILGTEICITTDLTEPAPGPFEVEIPEEGPVMLKKMTQQAVRRLERHVILKVLQAHHWNRRRTAEVLKISYRALLYKIRDAGLSPCRSPGKETKPESNVPAMTRDADEIIAPAELLMAAKKGSHA
jgi:two-component system response regulator AtoC